MKKVILILGSALFLVGCAAEGSKQAEQPTPQFGKPESAIPWNQPTDWEKNGSLGSMPGFNQQH
jgi:PBP1b-binding outer membrane lipoprotein LpoB